MRKKLMDMQPVDDIVTRNTPGLKIWDENWGGMQCAYHIFAPGTDFTDILEGKGTSARSVRGRTLGLHFEGHGGGHLP